MKLRFTRSETNANHYLKDVDDRPLILEPHKNDLILKKNKVLDSVRGNVKKPKDEANDVPFTANIDHA